MIISEKQIEEWFPGSLKAINEAIDNTIMFGTGAIVVTPDGIKSINITDTREFEMKHKGIESLTEEQQNEICAIIGDWYLDWKHGLINWDERTHRLGYAKEKLKEMICGTPNEIELVNQEPKYKIGQIVYLMGSDNHPIDEIKIDEIIYDEGDYWYLVYTSEGDYSHDCREFDQYREDCLYPSRQEFIESQIEYWLSLSDKSPTEILCGEIVGRAEKKLKYWQSLSNSDDANQCEKNSDECNHQWGGIITCENCGVLFDNSLV